eukprot:309959-Amorphochlora_amoeboformis.AAC.1
MRAKALSDKKSKGLGTPRDSQGTNGHKKPKKTNEGKSSRGKASLPQGLMDVSMEAVLDILSKEPGKSQRQALMDLTVAVHTLQSALISFYNPPVVWSRSRRERKWQYPCISYGRFSKRSRRHTEHGSDNTRAMVAIRFNLGVSKVNVKVRVSVKKDMPIFHASPFLFLQSGFQLFIQINQPHLAAPCY